MNKIVGLLTVIAALGAVLAVIGLTQIGVLNREFVGSWYFHLPNFVLAALMYTLLGRVLLAQFFDPDSPNYIWQFFVRFTDPVVNVVALVTPKAAAPVVLWLCGFVWLFWLRVLLFNLFLVAGIVPRMN